MRQQWWLGLVLVACESTAPSGAMFKPVAAAPVSVTPESGQAVEAGGFDFDADAPGLGSGGDVDQDVAAGLGLGAVAGVAVERVPTSQAPTSVAVSEAVAVSVAPVPSSWMPGAPLDGSWGVRLVSTVPNAQPPRAILGLPDGTEAVVQPGTLLPEAGIVVLAVGQDVVQLAEIVPQGDHVRVQTRTLQALYGAGASDR